MSKLYDIWPTNQAVPAGYEKLVELRDRLGKDETLRTLQIGSTVVSELNFEDGRIIPVTIDYWRSEFASEMLETGYKRLWFSAETPLNPSDSRAVFAYGQTWSLLLVELPDDERFTVNKVKSSSGGRPLKYDWAGAAAFIAYYVVEKDFPAQQAVLAKAVTAWFKRRGKVPEDGREVDRWIAEIYKERDALIAQRKQKPVG